jgi:hypothetical protein
MDEDENKSIDSIEENEAEDLLNCDDGFENNPNGESE